MSTAGVHGNKTFARCFFENDQQLMRTHRKGLRYETAGCQCVVFRPSRREAAGVSRPFIWGICMGLDPFKVRLGSDVPSREGG
jgi:hypothetical protein